MAYIVVAYIVMAVYSYGHRRPEERSVGREELALHQVVPVRPKMCIYKKIVMTDGLGRQCMMHGLLPYGVYCMAHGLMACSGMVHGLLPDGVCCLACCLMEYAVAAVPSQVAQ